MAAAIGCLTDQSWPKNDNKLHRYRKTVNRMLNRSHRHPHLVRHVPVFKKSVTVCYTDIIDTSETVGHSFYRVRVSLNHQSAFTKAHSIDSTQIKATLLKYSSLHCRYRANMYIRENAKIKKTHCPFKLFLLFTLLSASQSKILQNWIVNLGSFIFTIKYYSLLFREISRSINLSTPGFFYFTEFTCNEIFISICCSAIL